MRRGHVEAGELPLYHAHDALTDALGTAELFLAQTAHMAGGSGLRLRQLMRWSRTRVTPGSGDGRGVRRRWVLDRLEPNSKMCDMLFTHAVR